jgi:anti-sigma regulatory factor (Ser/Thr protein kinase)
MSTRLSTRSFVAERRALADVRRFVASEVRRHAFSAAVHDLQLAVKEIRVSVVPIGSCLEITVEDDGVYRRALPVPEADGTGHRGLHLMAAMVDDFTLHPGTEGHPGTVVRLVKCKR